MLIDIGRMDMHKLSVEVALRLKKCKDYGTCIDIESVGFKEWIHLPQALDNLEYDSVSGNEEQADK